MNNIKLTIASNLAELRKLNKLTQTELAEQLNYSDKAISKWERGESLPDIETLYQICELYGVTLNYLVSESNDQKQQYIKDVKTNFNNKIVITLLAVSLVWITTTICFVEVKLNNHVNLWQVFVWGVPASSILLTIFNAIWGKRKFAFPIASLFIWSLLVSLYCSFLEINVWPIFLIGIPIQIVIILWSQLKPRKK